MCAALGKVQVFFFFLGIHSKYFYAVCIAHSGEISSLENIGRRFQLELRNVVYF